MRKRRRWQGLTAEQFREYYQENYAGMTRCQVRDVDRGFYDAVSKINARDDVFPAVKERSWQDLSIDNLREFYQEHYNGMSRAEVQKADGSFYEAVRKMNAQGQIFPHRQQRNWEDMSVAELRDYYEKHYDGMSRTEVQKADGGFYWSVYKRKEQDQVFPKRKIKPKGFYKDIRNIKQGLEMMIVELGRFPSATEIIEREEGIYDGIKKYHGGLPEMKIKLGYADQEIEVIKEIIGARENGR